MASAVDRVCLLFPLPQTSGASYTIPSSELAMSTVVQITPKLWVFPRRCTTTDSDRWSLVVTRSLPNIILLAHTRPPWETIMSVTPQLSSSCNTLFGALVLTVFPATSTISSRGSSRHQRTRRKHHTPSFSLERLVSESPQPSSSSPMSLPARILITTTSKSSIAPTSTVVWIITLRPIWLAFTNLRATTA